MEPGVPFALIAAAQLLTVGAFLGLAGVFLRPPLRGPGRLGTALALLGTAGSLGVAVSAAIAGARLGPAASPVLAVVAGAGLLLVAVALGLRHGTSPGVLTVAPLGAALPPALVAVIGGVVAAGAALRLRGPTGRLLGTGLLLSGAAYALAPAARTAPAGAATLLGLRIAGALLLLGFLAYGARTSVLAKIVTAIGVGVLATAIGTACVVGTVVADQLAADQSAQLRTAAVGAANDLGNDAANAVQLARLIASCPQASTLTCAKGIAVIAPTDAFTAVVASNGSVTYGDGADRLGDDRAALLDLAQSRAVRDSFGAPALMPGLGSGFVLLHGRTTQLVAIGTARVGSGSAAQVVVYGEQVDQNLLAQTKARSTFDATVFTLPDGTPLVSTLGSPASLTEAARPVLGGLQTTGVATSRIGQGNTPAAAYVLLPSGTQRLAVLALSASSATVLRSQRTVLALLFTALLAIGALVAAVAYVLGRRAVEPVRSLTTAAQAVGAGDLSVRPVPTTADEVGQLAAVFAAMTGNLEALTGDLRATAETEAATRARLGTILDAMADALVVSDEAGTVDLANPAATALFGPIAGRPVDELIAGAAGEQVVEGLRGPVPVAVAVAPLPGGRGTVHVLRDVTATRQLERAKTEFLSNVSHELRTPLTPIQGYADLLRRRADLPTGQVQAMAESISEGARRMARVVGLLVDVAALDAGRIAPAPEVLRPAAVLDERLAVWRGRVPERAADLRRRVTAGTPELRADPQWLGRALDELIGNALAYSGAGSAVTLLAGPGEGGRVVLAVKDAGTGLDEAAQAGLFADFEQVDGSATRSHDGLGLGLAFVRRVALMLGAGLGVASRPGAGSTFSLDLPAAIPAPRSRRAAAPSPGGAVRRSPARRNGRVRAAATSVTPSRARARAEEDTR